MTREGVIERELLLGACQPYNAALAAETERNLRSLGTFRRVEVDTVHSDSGLVLRVETDDGWSTRPELTFSSTGEQATFTIGISEENFLGRAVLLGVRYSSDPDRRRTSFRFAQRRTFGDYGIQLNVENRTDGWNGSAGVARPFFSYETRSASGASLVAFDGDVRRFRRGESEPWIVFARQLSIARLHTARALRATPAGYWRIGALAQVVSDEYAPAGITRERYTNGAVTLWTELSGSRFIEVDHFRTLGRAEDVDLSPRIRAGVVVSPQGFGYERGGIGLELGGTVGTPVGRGFVRTELGANGRYTPVGLDSGQVTVSATALLRPTSAIAVLLHGRQGWHERPAPGDEYELGFGIGLRSHAAHAFTGDRVQLVAAELRWTSTRDLLGLVRLGLAAVGAHGGAWWAGDPRRMGSELGGGLRIGPSRLAGGTITRVDLMWRFATDVVPGGWTVVLGEGLTF